MKLPMELIVEILSMLPAKSLLQCRSVCKAWLSLINSPKFKIMHLHNFNQLNSRYLIRPCCYKGKQLYSVHLDDEALTIDGVTLLEFPFNGSCGNECFRISGCCNGVLCLFGADDEYESSFNMIILWNPSIRKKLTLTLPSFYPIDLKWSYFVLGFGYNKMSDDYKVVCLAYVGFHKPHQVKVYTVKTGIWREVRFPDDLSCFSIFPDCSQVFFNGSVHWIACDSTPGDLHSTIITFDTSSEIFGEILLPDDLVKVYQDTMMISVLGESLAVTYYKCRNMTSRVNTIWVMKEYKKPTSWTKIYDLHYPDIDMGIPLQLRNNGDMNMIIRTYSVYDASGEYDLDRRTYVHKYQESLVLLDVGDSLPNDE